MIRDLLPGIALALTASVAAQPPAWQAPPKLVVGIVVDQMRTDFIYRYWANFGEGGFKRLVGEGAFLRDAHYPYASTHTGPGHASIYTGTTPSLHGIVANDMFLPATGRDINCVQDDAVTGVGGTGPKGARSPVNLLCGTLTDEMERRFDGRSITVGVSMKDRGAILPIGRTGDAAYWFMEDADGRFGTSTWYAKELPEWMRAFNARDLVQEHLKERWEPLLPLDRYHVALPDENPYEYPIPGAQVARLPVDLGQAFIASGNSMEVVKHAPAALELTTALALAALEGEGMGTDAVPDLLAISYSATDELGHAMGPRALELEDMYLRLDRELERLLKALDTRLGRSGYTLFLTADHGVVDVPALLEAEGSNAGYVPTTAIAGRMETALSERFGPGQWIRRRIKGQFYLNDSLLQARTVDRTEAQHVAVAAARGLSGVADAFAAADILSWPNAEGLAGMVQRTFLPERCGDIYVVLRPGHLLAWQGMQPKGTEHGSPWTYDTHVPILFYGQGIRPGEIVRRTSITDIAPTLAVLLGTAFPDACSGHPVHEVLAP
ncbi:MAG TPA: alkaline phosphatase family protein [Flavobacteriales bacterium]|nr:alkaline phosphatase family protein [Flavobacteriales bacterium]HMR28749.1 alkaline phosphatase family protein [Flavobacteriales bacterium]